MNIASLGGSLPRRGQWPRFYSKLIQVLPVRDESFLSGWGGGGEGGGDQVHFYLSHQMLLTMHLETDTKNAGFKFT